MQCAECSVVDGGRSLPISGSAEEGGVAPCTTLHQARPQDGGLFFLVFCLHFFILYNMATEGEGLTCTVLYIRYDQLETNAGDVPELRSVRCSLEGADELYDKE